MPVRLIQTDPAVMTALHAILPNKMNRGTTKKFRAQMNRVLQTWKFAFQRKAVVAGDPIRGRAMVLYSWCVSRIDADAPLKAVQDACQGLLFAGGDGAVRSMAINMRRPDKGATRGPSVRPPLRECIMVEAYSMDNPVELNMAYDRAGSWILWSAARHAWVSETGRPEWIIPKIGW